MVDSAAIGLGEKSVDISVEPDYKRVKISPKLETVMANPSSFLAREQWTIPVKTWTAGTVGSPPQTPELDLVVSAIIAQEDVDQPVTLWVSLENSVVRPGSPLQDDDRTQSGTFRIGWT